MMLTRRIDWPRVRPVHLSRLAAPCLSGHDHNLAASHRFDDVIPHLKGGELSPLLEHGLVRSLRGHRKTGSSKQAHRYYLNGNKYIYFYETQERGGGGVTAYYEIHICHSPSCFQRGVRLLPEWRIWWVFIYLTARNHENKKKDACLLYRPHWC